MLKTIALQQSNALYQAIVNEDQMSIVEFYKTIHPILTLLTYSPFESLHFDLKVHIVSVTLFFI